MRIGKIFIASTILIFSFFVLKLTYISNREWDSLYKYFILSMVKREYSSLSIINLFCIIPYFFPYLFLLQTFFVKTPLLKKHIYLFIFQGIYTIFSISIAIFALDFKTSFNLNLFGYGNGIPNAIYLPATKYLKFYGLLIYLFSIWSVLLPTFIGKQLWLDKILEERNDSISH